MKTSKEQMEQVLQSVLEHFQRTTGRIVRILDSYVAIETDHGKCEPIGQFAFRRSPCVKTYFCCYEFRKGHVNIYFH